MGLMKLLCNHLPKGGEYKEARNFIYEEKNTLSKKDMEVGKVISKKLNSSFQFVINLD
jgi:hypothetical protein